MRRQHWFERDRETGQTVRREKWIRDKGDRAAADLGRREGGTWEPPISGYRCLNDQRRKRAA